MTFRPVARFLRQQGAQFYSQTAVRYPQRPAQMPLIQQVRTMSSGWDDRAAPPRLPPEEQAEFEKLVRQAQESAAAASLADAVAAANAKAEAEAAAAAAAKAAAQAAEDAAVGPVEAASAAAATSTPAETPASALNGNPIEGVWRGAPPEFDGDRNPKTGEVGGPKNEPLRWGSSGDWSFNGRVTDF
ncbi:hypothetical protein SEUCBS139899_009326 [Sporothrix eucalyptigena]|uniref:Succinate dehydrogenase assembly factor 4, mitochondrial n=1 Tax=Sporothrix eucalyptigena TaxID=1812306 RepID=A0ABP0AY73_9PEZI